MQSSRLPMQVSASGFFPAPIRPLIQPLEPAMVKLFFPDSLIRSISAAEPGADPSQFGERMLEELDIRYEVSDRDLARIPTSGTAMLIGNHPFGFLEGLILLSLLKRVRADFRIVANAVLASVSPIREIVIPLNPFRNAAPEENSRGLRDCMRWLRQGGLLAIFPAGEVAHLNWSEKAVVDPAWNTTAARLARKVGCPIVPLFFDGANSLPFQLLGTIYPGLRTLSLPRELLNKRKQTIRIRLGSPIPPAVLNSYPDAESATNYIRSRTFLLRNRSESGEVNAAQAAGANIAAAGSKELLLRELAALPAEQIFASSQDFTVYCATAKQIPNILREIGRERELSFRQVGEGTKSTIDLDSFDECYDHLFLWSNKDQKIAGGYRIVATPDVLNTRGVKGLYTSTLFHYDRKFFEHIGPAVELGRSFICREYQRHYASLLLLWKGIATYVRRRPECAVLFGAVSISGDYQAVSRELIVEYLNAHVAGEMKAWVKPRRYFRPRALAPKDIKRLSRMLSSLDELSSSISDVEGDGKGVPVLIRHYLKLGGQILGFNVDPEFSNALDALVFVDLRVMTDQMLERCMGREAAAEFRAWHAGSQKQPV